jgi:hypothetical protein
MLSPFAVAKAASKNLLGRLVRRSMVEDGNAFSVKLVRHADALGITTAPEALTGET